MDAHRIRIVATAGIGFATTQKWRKARQEAMTATTLLVSWVSFNSDPFERNKTGEYVEPRVAGPTLEILFSADSPLRGRVKHVYLLARRPALAEPDERRVHGREEDVVRELRRAIAERSEQLKVEICWWDTTSPPTDHRSAFVFVARELARIRKAHMRGDIAVHLSPGTPAKHATLLLALQARLGGTNVRAYQSTPASKRRDGVDRFQEVPWNLLAELAASAPPLDAGSENALWSIDVARSTAMRNVAAAVAQFAGVPFPVLIIGSRGTGKTEIAKRLRNGFRQWMVDASSKAWEFHLNCAEFRGDPNMLRSALFGHAKGAHSKAEHARAGLLENAADDCVFLDEIHWMDPQAQGLLLLALQRGGSFRRLGDENHAIPARFRLLAATNQKRQQLREHLTADFLDRISDLVIELPELRDCQEDLGDIWQSIVRLACEELFAHDKTRANPAVGASSVEAYAVEFQPHHRRIVQTLATMRLPGNFRDLERLARRLLVAGLSRGRFLALRQDQVASELDRLVREDHGDQGPAGECSLLDALPTVEHCEAHIRAGITAGKPTPTGDLMAEWERRLLVAALRVAGSGNKAASLVGMGGRTFNDRLKKLDSGEHRYQRHKPGARAGHGAR